MHLVCLGVMRRLLHIWIGGKYGRGKLTAEQVHMLSDRLNLYRKDFPSVFERKPRGVDEVERWKATEFRTFLLYAGPVALKHLLPDRLYHHFLVLHVAVRILASPSSYQTGNEYAKKRLVYFVEDVGELYGTTQVIYNVHSLIYLAGDCLRHGPFDSFSAFPFESHLGKLKQMLRTTNSPLSQINRRVSEQRHVSSTIGERPVDHSVRPGMCYILRNGTIARVNDVRAACVHVSVFANTTDFFVNPLKSSSLGIFRVDSNGDEKIMSLDICIRDRQCIVLPYKSRYVMFPLLHCTSI
ncbi:uncharacterized protein LOC135379173 [Ornithodoros turicata]|uniref:uncharacterized protein LOC135379173 n=1 Tax=Ornithodoros turicata TaxID=34597 RepID=UPI0031393385